MKKPRYKLWKSIVASLTVFMTIAGGLVGNPIKVHAATPEVTTTIETVDIQTGTEHFQYQEPNFNNTYIHVYIPWTAYSTIEIREEYDPDTGTTTRRTGRANLYIYTEGPSLFVIDNGETSQRYGRISLTATLNYSAAAYATSGSTISWSAKTKGWSGALWCTPDKNVTQLLAKIELSNGSILKAGNASGENVFTSMQASIMPLEYPQGMTLDEWISWYKQDGNLQDELETIIEINTTTNTKIDRLIELNEQILERIEEEHDETRTDGEMTQEDKEVLDNTIDSAETIGEKTNDLITAENALNTEDKINAVTDPVGQLTDNVPNRLTSAFAFVRSIHAATIERTPIKNYIAVVMLIGLAAYIIGRRHG